MLGVDWERCAFNDTWEVAFLFDSVVWHRMIVDHHQTMASFLLVLPCHYRIRRSRTLVHRILCNSDNCLRHPTILPLRCRVILLLTVTSCKILWGRFIVALRDRILRTQSETWRLAVLLLELFLLHSKGLDLRVEKTAHSFKFVRLFSDSVGLLGHRSNFLWANVWTADIT